MKSALPHDTVSGSVSSPPASDTRRPVELGDAQARPLTYAMRVAVGSGRGSNTGPSTPISRARPDTNPPANRRPATAKATTVPLRSVAYDVMPPAPSRARSRRARSSGGSRRCRRRPTSRTRGSATQTLGAGFDVEHPQRVHRVAAASAAQEDHPLPIGRHRHVARLAEREPLRSCVLAGEAVGHEPTVGNRCRRGVMAARGSWRAPRGCRDR